MAATSPEISRENLRAAIGQVQAAMQECADAGLEPQAEMMQIISEAFAAQGEDVPPLLRMLLG